MEFKGFSPETMDFFWGLRFNNNRDWFNAHKEQYQSALLEPMKALGNEVWEAMPPVPGLMLKFSRIYRDMRMHPPTPYKEHLWFCIRRQAKAWETEPCLFFDLDPEGCTYGLGLWGLRAPAMEELRGKLTARADEFLALVEKAEAATGISLTGDAYVRKRPAPDPRLEPYFQLKNFSALEQLPAGERLFSPSLRERVTTVFEAWLPAAQFFIL